MTKKSLDLILRNEAETSQLGALLAQIVFAPFTLYLLGELGAGKTTFSRGFLHGLGYQGIVKSPTYTLVEPYDFPLLKRKVLHFDLYRLSDPEELEFIGIRDYLTSQTIFLIEWPSQGAHYIPSADIELHLNYKAEQRSVLLQANSTQGRNVLQQLEEQIRIQHLFSAV